MLRISGGRFKGRLIKSLPGTSTRPPLGRVRQALGNILAHIIAGADVLDLYAGTGSYSFELLSRGARSSVMVDNDAGAARLMRDNVRSLGLEECCTVVQSDVLGFLQVLARQERLFDVILVAPPYFSGLDSSTMSKLGERPLIKPGGVVVLQQHRREVPVPRSGLLEALKRYRYGETVLTLYGIGGGKQGHLAF